MQGDQDLLLADDDVRYVTDELYEDIYAFYRESTVWTGEGVPVPAAAAVVTREARLLDRRNYEAWLELYSPRCVYWVPGRVDVGDPREEPALHFDDHRRLVDRVALIRTGFLHAQTPPSITCRIVGTVEGRTRGEGTCDVGSTVLIDAYRREHHVQFVGHQYHRMVAEDGAWRIRYRILLLNDRAGSQGNITFIL